MNESFLGKEESSGYSPTPDERTAATLAHLLTLVTGFIGPLIIYLLKKDDSRYVAEHAKESLNFQITIFLGYIIGIITTIILIGILILMVIGFVHLVLVIVATIKASENKMYRYPINFRIIR
ncbi:MAG TPA: DUF4870 domain-containing protein [Flavitalea sp.]|nr:DUF4870 domain-containing protein [Flavitalea sp.]